MHLDLLEIVRLQQVCATLIGTADLGAGNACERKTLDCRPGKRCGRPFRGMRCLSEVAFGRPSPLCHWQPGRVQIMLKDSQPAGIRSCLEEGFQPEGPGVSPERFRLVGTR